MRHKILGDADVTTVGELAPGDWYTIPDKQVYQVRDTGEFIYDHNHVERNEVLVFNLYTEEHSVVDEDLGVIPLTLVEGPTFRRGS